MIPHIVYRSRGLTFYKPLVIWSYDMTTNEQTLTEQKPKTPLTEEQKRERRNRIRRERDAALRSLGLTKVRGALGGTYWE